MAPTSSCVTSFQHEEPKGELKRSSAAWNCLKTFFPSGRSGIKVKPTIPRCDKEVTDVVWIRCNNPFTLQAPPHPHPRLIRHPLNVSCSRNCTICHGTFLFLLPPPLSKAQWADWGSADRGQISTPALPVALDLPPLGVCLTCRSTTLTEDTWQVRR